MSQTYQTKNYTAHGGAETVIGGKLTFLAGAVIDDQAGVIPTPAEPFTPAAAQADSEAASYTALKNDFNALLAKLRAAGLMETPAASEETPAAGGGETPAGGESGGGETPSGGESGGGSDTPAAEGGENAGGGS